MWKYPLIWLLTVRIGALPNYQLTLMIKKKVLIVVVSV